MSQSKYLKNCLKDIKRFPYLRFDLVVVKAGAQEEHKNLDHVAARKLLSQCTDVVEFVTD